jgi:hypothetical protein
MGIRRKVSFKNHEPQFPAPLEGYAATVELPEGHHVTIGELTPGTIVEVATWNGTGKPDESTKRFLISADGNGLTRRQGVEQNQIEENAPAQITNNRPEPMAMANTQPISDPIFGSYRSDVASKEVTFSDKPSNAIKALKLAGVPVLIIVLIGGLIKIAGISATVPTVGAKSFFGQSTNSVVFYKKGNQLNAGSPVVAKDKDFIIFGNYGGDVGNLSLFTVNGKQMSVPKEALSGRGIMLIPYVGSILKPILS